MTNTTNTDRPISVQFKNIKKNFGSFTAVKDLSLDIYQGEIFGFLGVNGAGKTTTLKMLVGILQQDSGDITVGGIDTLKESINSKRIIGYVPDRPYLYQKLTGKEFLEFVAELYEVPKKVSTERIAELLLEYKLVDQQHELIENYSHGMKQRLATCAALIHRPKVLILDEPMVGLDPHGAKLLKSRLKEYAKSGTTILLSTHSLNVAEEIADRLVIINKGEILTLGTVDEIKSFAGEESSSVLEDVFIKLTE